MSKLTPVQTTPYSVRYKIKSRLWGLVNITLFRWTPFFMRKYRVALTRMFGADIDWSCSLDSTATIIDPWNLKMGRLSSLGEYCCIRCRAKVTIGEQCCIGRDVYILTASHNINSPYFEMITAPITIGNNVWVATRSTISKGITIGNGAVIGAESLVTHDVAPWTVVGGNPAKFLKNRVIKNDIDCKG